MGVQQSMGLSSEAARERLSRDGPNALPASERAGARALLWEVVSEPMFLLLVAFAVLVLGNLGLIQVNRAWGSVGGGQANPAFGWMVAGTLVLLALALGVPAVAQLFRFAPPTWSMVGLSAVLAAVAWAWFACVGAWQARRGGGARAGFS